MRIFVAGAGAWGTALAMLLEENGHAVTLWTRNAEKAREIDVTRQNPALAGVTLPAGIRVTAELAEGTEELVRDFIAEESADDSFGNARGVRNLFEHILVAQNNRLAKMEQVTRDDLMQILPDDVLHARGKIDE